MASMVRQSARRLNAEIAEKLFLCMLSALGVLCPAPAFAVPPPAKTMYTDALARVRAAFADDPGLTAVFGSYDDAPPGGTVAAFRNLLHHHVHHRGAGPASTFWSGLGAIRRDAFLAAGEAALKTRPADGRDAEIDRLKAKVGELTMANELLDAKIDRLETHRPLARRRSRP